jgi:hypothetical protein
MADNNPELSTYKLRIHEYSAWSCEIWPGTVLRPLKGKEPNRFWRKMQYLILGFRWKKD